MRKLAIFIFLLVCLPAWATNYFVNNTCTNNGTGLSAACAASPGALGAYNSIANIAAGAYAAGNTIDGGGQTYRETMTVGGSGSVGSPIVIQNFKIKGSTVMTGWSSYGPGLGSTWQVAEAHQSTIVAVNGSLATLGGSATTLANGQWFWVSSVLYYRWDAGNPDSIPLTVEASTRANAIALTARNYITINNVAASQTESYAIRHATSSTNVTWNGVNISQVLYPAQLTAATVAVLNNATITQQIGAASTGITIDTSSLAGLTLNNRITYYTLNGNAINQSNSNASTVVADNNGMVDSYIFGAEYSLSGASTLNMLGDVSPGTSYGTPDFPIKGTAGNISVDYSNILPDGQNGAKEPVSATNVTEGTHNIYTYPGWTSPRVTGVIGFSVDDYPDMCDWAIGNMFSNQFGVPYTLSLSQTYLFNSSSAPIYKTTATANAETICFGSPFLSVLASSGSSTTDQAIIQTQLVNGNDVVSHTRSHGSLSTLTNGACASTLCLMEIQYTGTGSAATVTVAGSCPNSPCTLTTSVTGAADNLSYDLTPASSFYSAQLLCAAIAATGKYTCTQSTASHESYGVRVPSVMMEAVSGQDIKTAAYAMLLDQTSYFANEIAGSMTDMNAAFNCTSVPHVGACATGTFTTTALQYPDGNNNSTVWGALQAAGYKGARTVAATGWTFPQNMFLGASTNIAEWGTVFNLGFESSCNDASANANNFTCSNVSYDTSQWYRVSHSGLFNGTTSYAYHAAASALSDFHRGDFALGAQLYPTTLNASNTIYFQRTDDNNYIWLYVNSAGAVVFSIYSGGAEIVHLQSGNGAITTGTGTGATATSQEISVMAHTNTYRLFVNYAPVASQFTKAKPPVFSGNVQIGRTDFGGTAGNWFTGYMDDVAAGREGYMATTSQLATLAANGGYILYTNHGEGDAPREIVQAVYEAVQDFTRMGGNVKVMTQSQALNYIYSVGTLGADNETINWNQTDQHNYRPRFGSALCGAGTTPGLTTDADGMPWLTQDIGPYRCAPKTMAITVM